MLPGFYNHYQDQASDLKIYSKLVYHSQCKNDVRARGSQESLLEALFVADEDRLRVIAPWVTTWINPG